MHPTARAAVAAGVAVGVAVVALSYGTLWEFKGGSRLDVDAAHKAVTTVSDIVASHRHDDGRVRCDTAFGADVLDVVQTAVAELEGDFDSSDLAHASITKAVQDAAMQCAGLARDAAIHCADSERATSAHRLCMACADLALVADADDAHLGALVAATTFLVEKATAPGNAGTASSEQALLRRAALFEEMIALRPNAAELRVAYAAALAMAQRWVAVPTVLAKAAAQDVNGVHTDLIQHLRAVAEEPAHRVPAVTLDADPPTHFLAPGVPLQLVPDHLWAWLRSEEADE